MIEDVLCVFCCFPQFVLRYTILRKLVVSILGWAFPKIVIFHKVFRNKMASVFAAPWLPSLILSSHLSDLKAARAAPRLTMRLSSSTAVAPLPTVALSGAGSCLRFRTFNGAVGRCKLPGLTSVWAYFVRMLYQKNKYYVQYYHSVLTQTQESSKFILKLQEISVFWNKPIYLNWVFIKALECLDSHSNTLRI